MKPIVVPAPKLEDVITEDEYALTWYYCQLKVDDELKDYQCDYNEEGPNCTTCPLQIKTNEEIQRNYEEIMEKNRHLATSQRLARTEAEG